MKYLLISMITLIYLTNTGYSQVLHDSIAKSDIQGRIVDQNGKGVGFANVLLYNVSDSLRQTQMLTDTSGYFNLLPPLPDRFYLEISAIGFKAQKTAVFTAENLTHFQPIVLKEEFKALTEVSVTALRPTITQLADRMVVNVEGTAMVAGNTAFGILSKAPGVFVDGEGNVQLNGRSGVLVMLNGKQTFLSARELRNLLESTPAENIKNIEVITNPSARYDAEGTAGILNINLKRNIQQGINGTMSLEYSTNFHDNGYGLPVSLNHRSGKWNSFMTSNLGKRVNGREGTFTRIFYGSNTTTYFDQEASARGESFNIPALRLGTDYNINPMHSIGVVASYSRSNSNSAFYTETYVGNDPQQASQSIDAKNLGERKDRSYSLNAHYVGKLDTVGTTLSADLDYISILNRGEANFYNYFTNTQTAQKTQDFLFTDIAGGYDIYSARLDFAKQLNKKFKLELGSRASKVISDNDSKFYFNNGSLQLDPQRTNHFNYRESIFAGYFNINGPVSKVLTFQAGLRAEETQSKGISFTTGELNKRSYLDLFPSLFLQQKVNANYEINYSYSRRISRPNYGRLNPFRFYRDPYTWEVGNPYLKPQYTHSFGLSQLFNRRYNLALTFHFNKDIVSELPILDVSNATTTYTHDNFTRGRSISLTGVGPLRITKKWDTQNTLLLNYAKFETTGNNGNLENDQLFFMLQSNHTILLPKSFRMEMNLLYRGPAASGLYHQKAMSRVDFGLRKSFAKNKLDFALNVVDIFKGFRLKWSTDINGNVNDFDQYLYTRTLGISLRYSFSKGQKVDNRRRNNVVEELNRAN